MGKPGTPHARRHRIARDRVVARLRGGGHRPRSSPHTRSHREGRPSVPFLRPACHRHRSGARSTSDRRSRRAGRLPAPHDGGELRGPRAPGVTPASPCGHRRRRVHRRRDGGRAPPSRAAGHVARGGELGSSKRRSRVRCSRSRGARATRSGRPDIRARRQHRAGRSRSSRSRTGRLLGAQLLGRYGAEVSKRLDVFALALFHDARVDGLEHVDLSYTPPLASPWDAVQMATMEWTLHVPKAQQGGGCA